MSLTVRKLQDMLLSIAVKRKALEEITFHPNKMIDVELKGDPHHLNILTMENIEYILHNAYHTRKKVRPNLPKSIDEVFPNYQL